MQSGDTLLRHSRAARHPHCVFQFCFQKRASLHHHFCFQPIKRPILSSSPVCTHELYEVTQSDPQLWLLSHSWRPFKSPFRSTFLMVETSALNLGFFFPAAGIFLFHLKFLYIFYIKFQLYNRPTKPRESGTNPCLCSLRTANVFLLHLIWYCACRSSQPKILILSLCSSN